MHKTGIIILAAGNSSRLGRPKQLLRYLNKSLIEHITGEALKAKLYPVVVVTGANTEQVTVALQKNIQAVYNKHWQTGMASGIVAGISELILIEKEVENIITCVCDQPFVSAELFEDLIKKERETGKGIIACAYADTIGTPVLFERKYFKHLQGLKGREGAKRLLKIYRDDVATVSFPKGAIDIDTVEDYKNLLAEQNDVAGG